MLWNFSMVIGRWYFFQTITPTRRTRTKKNHVNIKWPGALKQKAIDLIICSLDFCFPSPTEVFSVGSMVKNPPAGARDSRDLSSILWSGRKSQPTPVSLLGKPHGQRSLVGYHLRGCKESNMTEQPSTHAYLQQVMDRHLCVWPLPPRPLIPKPRYWGVLTYTFNMGLTSYVLLW